MRASSGDVRQMEQGAAPAGGLVTRTREAPGTPPSGHYEPDARSSLDGSRGSAPGRDKRRAPAPGPKRSQGGGTQEARPRGQKSRAVGRRSAPSLLLRRRL